MSARLVVTPNDLCVCVWVKVCFGLGEFTCRCAHVCECMCVKSTVNRRFYHAPASDPLRPWRLCCSEPCCCVWVCAAYVPALALAAASAPWEDCWRVSKATLIPLSHLSHLLFCFLSLCLSVLEGSWCWKKLQHPLTFLLQQVVVYLYLGYRLY